jgi:hypothetical protein
MAATVAETAPVAALTAAGPARASQVTPTPAPRGIRRAVLVPDSVVTPTADLFPTALAQLADLGVGAKVVSLLPAPTAPGNDETAAAIAKAVGDNRHLSRHPSGGCARKHSITLLITFVHPLLGPSLNW